MAQTASDLLVERLIDWGADTIFGLPGHAINGFFEALRKAQDRIRFVHVRHEEVAALAACGYARSATSSTSPPSRPAPPAWWGVSWRRRPTWPAVVAMIATANAAGRETGAGL